MRWWWAAAGSGGMGKSRRHFYVPRMMSRWRQRGRFLARREGRRGVEVDLADASSGTAPLLQAAFQNFPEVVDVLLEHRADANKEKYNGFTPLMVAAQQGSVQVAKLLLAKGADKAAKAGQAPLFLASRNGHKDVVVTLLAAGADKRAEWQGWTAQSVARHLGHREVIALLA